MKRIKTIKITGLFVLALLLGTRTWAQSNTAEQLVVPLSDPGKPFKLNASLLNGSITLTSYEGKDIVVDAQSNEEKGGRAKEAGGMRRLSPANSLDITAEEHNNQVNIHSSIGNKNTNLNIKVPRSEVKLRLSTVNNGDITVSNVSGELEITNVNGAIKATNVSGSVVANTVNGEVKVSFKTIDPKAAMAFSTLNGNVDVTFPATLKANVKLKSDRGDIYTDFDVVTSQQKPAVSRTSKAGMYNLKIDDWVYGKIDGGGPEMLMKNMNGNIYIRKTK